LLDHRRDAVGIKISSMEKRSLFMALLLLLASNLNAQEERTLRVVVEGVGREAAACGIGIPALEAVAARTLKTYGVAVTRDPTAAYLYLNVNAYRVLQGSAVVGCTTRIGVSVRSAASAGGVLRGFRPKTHAHLVVCEEGRLLSGALHEMTAAVTRGLEQDIKSCLGQLSH